MTMFLSAVVGALALLLFLLAIAAMQRVQELERHLLVTQAATQKALQGLVDLSGHVLMLVRMDVTRAGEVATIQRVLKEAALMASPAPTSRRPH